MHPVGVAAEVGPGGTEVDHLVGLVPGLLAQLADRGHFR